jgi:hypothetical protein
VVLIPISAHQTRLDGISYLVIMVVLGINQWQILINGTKNSLFRNGRVVFVFAYFRIERAEVRGG